MGKLSSDSSKYKKSQAKATKDAMKPSSRTKRQSKSSRKSKASSKKRKGKVVASQPRAFDVQSRVHRCRFLDIVPSGISVLAFDCKGQRLAVGRQNGDIEIWSLEHGFTCSTVRHGILIIRMIRMTIAIFILCSCRDCVVVIGVSCGLRIACSGDCVGAQRVWQFRASHLCFYMR